MDDIPLNEILVRAALIAVNVTLLVFKSIALFAYVRRHWDLLKYTGKDKDVLHLKANLTIWVRAGNILVYSVFAAAIFANAGRGLSVWQFLFLGAFLITLRGVWKMMKFELNAIKWSEISQHRTDV